MFDENVDIENAIIECNSVDADDLYDLAQEARLIDLPSMEMRVEVERRAALEYEDYSPMFSTAELVQFGKALMKAKAVREMRNDTARVSRINELAEKFENETES